MRKLRTIIAVALSAAALAVVPAVASASAAPGHRAEVCHSEFKPDSTTAGQSTAHWTINSIAHLGCGYVGRDHIHCVQFTGGPYLNEYGGKVTGEGVKDQAKCPGGYFVMKAGWQIFYSTGPLTSWYSGSVHTTALVAHRTCFTGSLSWGIAGNGDSATTSLNTPDSPAGCEQILTRIKTTGGNTYRSGLIRNPGAATAFSRDGTQVAEVWTEKQPNGDPGGRRCRQDFPNFEVNFHPCTGIKITGVIVLRPVHRAALELAA